MNRIDCILIVLLSGYLFDAMYLGTCWKAVPANQATYALRSYGVPDEMLPRDQLNFVYKFGWCRPDVLARHYIRKSVNMTVLAKRGQEAEYVYLVDTMHTQRYAFQCIVMKSYVNRKYIFRRSRIPLYYCQGTLLILMLRTVNRYAIHEFYIHQKLNMPMSFVFEFYQAPQL